LIKRLGFKFFEQRKNCTSFPFHKQNVLNTLFGLMSSFIEFFHKHGDGFGEECASNGILFPINSNIQLTILIINIFTKKQLKNQKVKRKGNFYFILKIKNECNGL